MKTFLASLLLLVGYVSAFAVPDENPVFGYLTKYGVPEAERIRKAEESALSGSRIVGGVPAAVGQYPYQAGLLIAIIGEQPLTGVCGATLVTPDRLLTAAHCWFDGTNRGWRITVVLGSVTLFTGGTRVDTSVVVMHPNWIPQLARNDVAVIYLPTPVTLSAAINIVSLPEGRELEEDFVGVSAIASGFGLTSSTGSITTSQYLSHVNLNVITNGVCSWAFPLHLQPSNLCTSGVGGVGTCRGDSGGPLVTNRNGRPILIGITSFGSGLGCTVNMPSVYARVTSFLDFFNRNL